MTHKQALKFIGLGAALGTLSFFFTDSLPSDLRVLGVVVSGVLGYVVGRATAPWIFKE